MRTRSTKVERVRWKSRKLSKDIYKGDFCVIEAGNYSLTASNFEFIDGTHEALILPPDKAEELIKFLNALEWEANPND